MNVLSEFRTDVQLNQISRGRLKYERARAAEVGELEDARTAMDAAVAPAEAAQAAAEAAQATADAAVADRPM